MHKNETMYKNHMMWVLNYIALPQVFSYPPQKNTLMPSSRKWLKEQNQVNLLIQ